ncbi:MAG TPA: Ig-like domain-containing protein [Baekduia sp.]|nr:Ig-like domain-containing protein [Baekduia sp.]
MRPLALVRCVLAVLALGVVSVPVAGAAEPGLNLPAPFDERQPSGSYVAGSGAQWARNFVSWNELEPARGQYNTKVLDALAASTAALRSHGLKPLFTVVLAPSWASGSADPHAPPADPADYARFLGHLASYPGLKGNVVAYELWNEEDSPGWWTGAPDAAAYTALLQAGYPAVKAADPAATVLVGGLTGSDHQFLEQIYAAGGQGSFDGVAVHSDVACSLVSADHYYRDLTGRISQYSFTGYREVHQTMVAHGDGDKDIYMTELGWSTSSRECDQGLWKGQKAGGVTEAKQAGYLAEAYRCLAADPYVKMAAWFTVIDTSAADTPNTRYGLLRSNGAQKPAAKAFKQVTKGPVAPRRCGGHVDLLAPRLTVTSPREGQQFTASLPITVRGVDEQRLGRVALFCDGVKIRNFVARSASSVRGEIDWQGAKKLPLGPHTVTAIAIDHAQNQTVATMNVVKVQPSALAPVKTATTLRRGRPVNGVTPVTVRVVPQARPVALTGKVTVLYSKRVGSRWKVAHKYTKPAKRSFTLRIALEPGTWRAQAVYAKSAPFQASRSPARPVRG